MVSGFTFLTRRLVAAVAFMVLAGGAVTARAQVTAQALIGSAVSDDSMNKEINNAIARFRDRDIDGCRAILERAKSNNPKISPPGVMMATLWLAVNQLPPAREELENAAVKYPADPEAYWSSFARRRRSTKTRRSRKSPWPSGAARRRVATPPRSGSRMP